MRKLFAFLLIVATPVVANETSYWSLQSGPGSLNTTTGPTPIYDHGIHGEGQIIAILDTGVDYKSCYFAEADGSMPPINAGSPAAGFAWQNVIPSRRKIIAYDFLYSCDQFPGAANCDDPAVPSVYDKQGHGTHAAASAVGDKGTPIAHDYADALATGAKLIVQDAGYVPPPAVEGCTQRPGIGCPVNITPILDQAYKQGARIDSNSWGDAQGSPYAPPTANYSQSARDVDAFVWSHPDMLVVFNTGNYGGTGQAPSSTLSAPGCAKNTLQVGGTRPNSRNDNWLSPISLNGPTRDGRVKPDVVGPSYVVAGDASVITGSECAVTAQPGTSWSSPTIAGAAALVRQYYTDGFYPTGAANRANAITPSAALLKATIIAAARRVPYQILANGQDGDTGPVPSYQQGWGFPVLADALSFAGNRSKLKIADVANDGGLAQGQTTSMRLNATAGTPLKVVLVWTDPPGVVRGTTDSTPELVNDLDLRVTMPDGTSLWGNDSLHPGQPDRLNNVEVVSVPTPSTGSYTITVSANHLGQGPRQGYALVVTGDVSDHVLGRVRAVRR